MTPSSRSSQASGKTPSGSNRAPAVSKLRMQIPSCDEQKQIPPLSLRLRSGSGRDDDAGFGGTTMAQFSVFQIDALVAIDDGDTDFLGFWQGVSLRELGAQRVKLAGARDPELGGHVVLREHIF